MEIEHRYRTYNKQELSRKLKGVKKHAPILLRNTIYRHAHHEYYIRVRETPTQAFVTLKTPHSEFWEEIESAVTDATAIHTLLTKLDCQRVYVVEKLREIWDVKGGIELAFDQYPGLPEFLEIETPNKTALRSIEKKLDLTPESFGVRKLYDEAYGAKEFKGDIEFKTATRVVGTAVTKNKTAFTKLLRAQKKLL